MLPLEGRKIHLLPNQEKGRARGKKWLIKQRCDAEENKRERK